jgi:hypothetical protein
MAASQSAAKNNDYLTGCGLCNGGRSAATQKYISIVAMLSGISIRQE